MSNRPSFLRTPSQALAAAAVITAATQATAQPVQRWVCTFADGESRVVAADLARRYPASAATCTAMQAPAAPSREPVVSPVFRSNVIQAPAERKAASGFRGLTPALAAKIHEASNRQQLDPLLVASLIRVESAWRSDARSHKGALGLMQLMPATARRYGVERPQDLLDPHVNLAVGTRHLRSLHERYGDRLDLVLAAYNAGEGAVQRYGEKVPPYRETQAYVRDILALMSQARGEVVR